VVFQFYLKLKNKLVGIKKSNSMNNPLSIVDDPQLKSQHPIPNLIPSYEGDVYANLARLQHLNNGLTPDTTLEMLVYMAIDNFITYKTNARILPMCVIVEVKRQIRQAFINVYIDRGQLAEILSKFEKEIMKKVWEDVIEQKTITFMEKLDNKHFK
jgi:hypothetical protein